MLIQPPQGQNNNPYLTPLAANTDNGRNQAAAGQAQPAARREDVFTLSAAGEQRQNETQAAAPQTNENTGGAPAVTEAAMAGETAPAPAAGTETERTAPAPAETEQMAQPAYEAVQQQQPVTENPNTGAVTGLNVIG